LAGQHEVVAVPVGFFQPIWRIHGKASAGGASIVMERFAANCAGQAAPAGRVRETPLKSGEGTWIVIGFSYSIMVMLLISRRLFPMLSALAVGVSAVAVLLPVDVPEVKAATITINTLTDVTDANDGLITLREAIGSAVAGDVVEFSSSLFSSGPQTLQITDFMSVCCKGLFEIRGPGRDVLTIKGPKSDRTITGYSVSNNVLTVTLSSAPAFTPSTGGLQG
jgi:hypothetical protein